jgi:plasmid maintenance system antidote protein VapI
MKRAMFFVGLLFASICSRDARADQASDVAEKLVVALEQVATIVDGTKNNCDAMGDRLDAYYQLNAQFLRDAKAFMQQLTPEQQRVLKVKFQARSNAAMAKIQPGMMNCMNNAKVMAVIQQIKRT